MKERDVEKGERASEKVNESARESDGWGEGEAVKQSTHQDIACLIPDHRSLQSTE